MKVKVDIGDGGRPGSSAAETICEIRKLPSGRWEAKGSHETGSNQGYFEAHYSYGPWRGRGDTPEEAAEAMINRADDEYQRLMVQAVSDALIELEDKLYAEKTRTETD